MRRLPDTVQRHIQDPIRDGLNVMGRTARNLAPVEEGDLRDSIDVKMSRDKLSGVVGPGAKAVEIVKRRTGSVFGRNAKSGKSKGQPIRLSKTNKHLYFQFLKAYWHEFGTKGSTEDNIPPLPARPFMRPAREAHVPGIVRKVAQGVNKALRKAANG